MLKIISHYSEHCICVHTGSVRHCNNELGLIQDSVQLSASADISDRNSVGQSVVIGLSWFLP